jgi:hypothetical protein
LKFAFVHVLFQSFDWGVNLHLVFNERAKHTASWFNAIATALIAAGAFAPAAAYLYGLSALPVGSGLIAALVVGCVGLGICLHLTGRALLGRLRE